MEWVTKAIAIVRAFLWLQRRYKRSQAKRMIAKGRCPECHDDDPYCRVCESGELARSIDPPVFKVILWERWQELHPDWRS